MFWNKPALELLYPFREGLAVIKPVESKFASINDNYRGALAQLCGNLARFLVLSPQVKVDVAKEAVTLAQKAVKLMPQLRLWWNTLCLAQYRAGNFKAARATMTQSLARSKGGDCRILLRPWHFAVHKANLAGKGLA